jgi:hypothetical protein
MQKLFSKSALLLGVLALSLTACEKDEVKVTSEFSAAPVLTASTNNAGVLSKANAQNTAITYTWTPYTIKTSDNSKVASTVTYTLQFAKAGTNFASVKEIGAGSGSASSLAIKTVDLNKTLLALGLPFAQTGQVEVRLKTFVAGNLPVLYSAVTPLSATPYDECTAPTADSWGLVGPAGDGWPGATATDRALKYDCNVQAYVLRTTLNAGAFKFRANQDWATNLGGPTGNLQNVPLALNGPDMTIATPGTYTVKLVVTLDAAGKTTGGTLSVTP